MCVCMHARALHAHAPSGTNEAEEGLAAFHSAPTPYLHLARTRSRDFVPPSAGDDIALSNSAVHVLARNMNNFVYLVGDRDTGEVTIRNFINFNTHLLLMLIENML